MERCRPPRDADFVEISLLHAPMHHGDQTNESANVYLRSDEDWAAAHQIRLQLFSLPGAIGHRPPQRQVLNDQKPIERRNDQDEPPGGDSNSNLGNGGSGHDMNMDPALPPPPPPPPPTNDDGSNRANKRPKGNSQANAANLGTALDETNDQVSAMEIDNHSESSNLAEAPRAIAASAGGSNAQTPPLLTPQFISSLLISNTYDLTPEKPNDYASSSGNSVIRDQAGGSSHVTPPVALVAGASGASEMNLETQSSGTIDTTEAENIDPQPMLPLDHPGGPSTSAEGDTIGATVTPVDALGPPASAPREQEIEIGANGTGGTIFQQQVNAAERTTELPGCPVECRQRHLRLADRLQADLVLMADVQAQVARPIIRMMRTPHIESRGRNTSFTDKVLTAVVQAFAYAGLGPANRTLTVDELATSVLEHTEHTGKFAGSNIGDRIP